MSWYFFFFFFGWIQLRDFSQGEQEQNTELYLMRNLTNKNTFNAKDKLKRPKKDIAPSV